MNCTAWTMPSCIGAGSRSESSGANLYFGASTRFRATMILSPRTGTAFIRPELVMNARREDVGEPFGDLIVGIDPAAQGAHSTGGGSWGGLRFPTK